MSFEEAKELARGIKGYHTVIVVSDGQIYLNVDEETVISLTEDKEIFVIKPEHNGSE